MRLVLQSKETTHLVRQSKETMHLEPQKRVEYFFGLQQKEFQLNNYQAENTGNH